MTLTKVLRDFGLGGRAILLEARRGARDSCQLVRPGVEEVIELALDDESRARPDSDSGGNFVGHRAWHIVDRHAGMVAPKSRIWANGVHAVDGTWNSNGTPMTNAEIGATVSQC